ncbi:hypothetical protein RCL1_001435 [Eukaryota sp. TZLM3-RCL]
MSLHYYTIQAGRDMYNDTPRGHQISSQAAFVTNTRKMIGNRSEFLGFGKNYNVTLRRGKKTVAFSFNRREAQMDVPWEVNHVYIKVDGDSIVMIHPDRQQRVQKLVLTDRQQAFVNAVRDYVVPEGFV